MSALALSGCGGGVESVQNYAAAAADARASTAATATAVATPGGPVAQGEGFTFSVPAGWHNEPTGIGESAISALFGADRPDVVVLGAVSGGLSSNVDVYHVSGANSRDLDAVAAGVKAVAEQRLGGITVGAVDRLTLGGEPAVAYTLGYTNKGQSVRARQVLTSHYLQLRAVTLTSAMPSFNHDLVDFQGMLASWVWR
ncbi:MAG: hypothetical protein E6J14_13525 [Chloroflexi bacterium]|nr:MAG: hypothetical protein E6J14_13525 [Chloroflexota bacterium]